MNIVARYPPRHPRKVQHSKLRGTKPSSSPVSVASEAPGATIFAKHPGVNHPGKINMGAASGVTLVSLKRAWASQAHGLSTPWGPDVVTIGTVQLLTKHTSDMLADTSETSDRETQQWDSRTRKRNLSWVRQTVWIPHVTSALKGKYEVCKEKSIDVHRACTKR